MSGDIWVIRSVYTEYGDSLLKIYCHTSNLVMAKDRSKRRSDFLSLFFTVRCFKKPLLIRTCKCVIFFRIFNIESKRWKDSSFQP